MGKVQPFRLDDDTIIYVQSNEDIDTSELIQAIETPAAPPINDLEDDLPPPAPAPAPPTSDSDEELEGYGPTPKVWRYPSRHGVPSPGQSPTQPPAPPTPAQRVGTLVKAYTTYLIKDIRDAALTEVQVEKVVLEFGIGLDTKAQIPYIASSSIACSVKVAIECKLNPPQTTQNSTPSAESSS
ncbi:CU044_2847 family protein [Leptothoe sp. PORK10 BA2]|uniref:CU044_2847 family protein n=1 Tax=Leptothoe sp. PORK10 BA2 TaxID=3110254 RepID=UPI002B1F9503|nr:CU044_2847 family protein [Leptothoe sp. PORK10 BA2]MEA5464041.1 CU044_2847 family protein [Leptothoe sp. PORK10 BA2]